jgi:CheY-like chemotaxis protein
MSEQSLLIGGVDMVGIKVEKPDLTVIVPRRILIVDDYVNFAEGLAKWLRCLGNDVEVAFDGLEGIEAAEKFRPDIILLDISMPKLNGYELAERIRQEPWGKHMMLVALTGYKGQEERERIRKGFDAHLVKPLIYKQVAALLASYSTSSRAFVPRAVVPMDT